LSVRDVAEKHLAEHGFLFRLNGADGPRPTSTAFCIFFKLANGGLGGYSGCIVIVREVDEMETTGPFRLGGSDGPCRPVLRDLFRDIGIGIC
jgi:hypothetical protein